jgi:hypothetical protein
MLCLVYVRFMPEGSLPPDEFFTRLGARWFYYDGPHDQNAPEPGCRVGEPSQSPKEAVCLTNYETIEQMALDLAVMPGAGIASIEVFPLPTREPAPCSPGP